MELRNEDIPENLGELSGESPYTEFVILVKKLLAEAKRIHPDGDIVLTYVDHENRPHFSPHFSKKFPRLLAEREIIANAL